VIPTPLAIRTQQHSFICRPDVASVTLRYKYLIRAQKFKELCYRIEKNKDLDQIPLALDYLQTQVTPLVDNEDDQERVTLARLCTRLCLLGDEGRTWQRPMFLQQSSGKRVCVVRISDLAGH
jgi:hypothetical protein